MENKHCGQTKMKAQVNVLLKRQSFLRNKEVAVWTKEHDNLYEKVSFVYKSTKTFC